MPKPTGAPQGARLGGAKLSVVVPVHDEELALEELLRRLVAVLDRVPDLTAEIVFVDDGSRDASFPLLVALARADTRVKVAQLSRNFGHQVALTAGIELATGDAVVTMDADLQHPPETLEQFVALWRDGYDVVYGVMVGNPEGWFKRATSRLYYRFLNRLTSTAMPEAAGDFRLIDRAVVDAFLTMPERDRYLRGMFAWLGFRQIGIEYVPAPRYAGASKYSLTRMFGLAIDGVLSFSILPLRLVIGIGLSVSLISFIFGIVSAITKIAGLFNTPGWATLVVVITFIGGIQLIVLGVMGEYLGRVYEETKRRPLYVVRHLVNFEDVPD